MIEIGLLKNFSRVKKYGKGAAFEQDSAGDLYIILKGEIGLFINYHRQGEEMIARIGPGNFFGDTASLMKKRKLVAAALTDVFLLPLNKGTMKLLTKGEPDVAAELIKAMYDRLDSITADYEVLSGRPWSEARPMLQPDEGLSEPEAEDATGEKSEMTDSSEAADAPISAANVALFPEGHGSYQLPLREQDASCLMAKSVQCPLCKTEFKTQRIKNSKLLFDHTDSDMRNHYKGIEPLYYDVVTCPRCFYSALAEMFEKPEKGMLSAELEAVKRGLQIRTGADMDTYSLFAGYYLALLCAPKCFPSNALASAKLYLKLSHIYQDCGDKHMEDETSKKALKAYLGVYEKGDLTESQEQQLCLIIGELSYKTNDLKNALDFLFKAKNIPNGSPLIKSHAQSRIIEIRRP